jgi:hypothetical protein
LSVTAGERSEKLVGRIVGMKTNWFHRKKDRPSEKTIGVLKAVHFVEEPAWKFWFMRAMFWRYKYAAKGVLVRK